MSTGAIGHRICCFGDSLVNGVRDGEKGGWPMRLGRRLLDEAKREVTIYNLGIRAETTEGLKARWKFEAELRMVTEFPNVLMFSFGVNDANHAEDRGEETTMRVSPAKSATNAAEIIGEAVKLAPTLWIGPQAVIDGSKSSQEINERLEGLNQIYLETARGFDVPYLDLFKITLADETWQKALRRGDGYHPDKAGYDRVAELIWEWDGWKRAVGLID
ncbi:MULTISPECIES: GDSL-type esterase/lipase family protein [Thalassospira]|uniref:Acyl-CoA thioesterase n=2 Tax=Thalassospira TaxID=168934 RepID=A0A367W7Y5_9PROT|nr:MULTISPECIES: GDSL-type esterase/lipase family protein [Thalassospira]MDG4720480.1 GDSL-type esterase/lipase family protein [Thalassospira sp. FZY0004]RCK37533.1 acyl-CoA thioesterase [Thalassospira profundimaris]